MQGLCGWFGSSAAMLHERAVLEGMSKCLHPSPGPLVYTPQAACAAPGGSVGEFDGLLVAIVGHPDWSAPELARLKAEQGAAQALAAAYRRYDAGFLGHLQGAFAVAVLDTRNRRLLAAIDRMGQHALYYALTTHGLVLGSTAASVRAHPDAGSRLSSQAIFNYMYFHMVPSPGSIYEGQGKLPMAHYLDYRAGRLDATCYWQPPFSEPDQVSGQELGEELRALISTSVQRLSGALPVGAFLSGGLDSSTVAGMLAQVQPGANTYSIGFAEDHYDEIRYARIAARHFKTCQHEYYVTPQDVVGSVPLIARSYDEPFGNSSAVPVYHCARLAARDGVQRMLAGDGGDELFAGNARYARQQLFERYQALPAALRRGVVEPLLLRLPGTAALVRKAQSYIRQANIPLPERLQTYNFLHHQALEEVFTQDFLTALDPGEPLRLAQELYRTPATGSALNRMLYLDWQHTLADNDLRKVSRMCDLAGVEAVYPFLDDALVAFSCRVPSTLKLKGQRLRYFYKQAMRNFLPAEIIRKSKHGFGLPFGIWLRSYGPLQELAYDSLLGLKKRQYFRAGFIDQVTDRHRGEHAAYYGELIWVLMMLEQWLERQPGARQAHRV